MKKIIYSKLTEKDKQEFKKGYDFIVKDCGNISYVSPWEKQPYPEDYIFVKDNSNNPFDYGMEYAIQTLENIYLEK